MRPGDLSSFRTIQQVESSSLQDEDDDMEGLPNFESSIPYERLVLWTDPNDPSNIIEVVPDLASKLRPHQREGVQFLFECTSK